MRRILLIILFSLVPVVRADDKLDAQRLVELGSKNIRAHDPSTIIKCGDEYWCFSTGRGIRSIHSRNLEKWDVGPHVFEKAPAWNREVVPDTTELVYWAPDVIRLGDR